MRVYIWLEPTRRQLYASHEWARVTNVVEQGRGPSNREMIWKSRPLLMQPDRQGSFALACSQEMVSATDAAGRETFLVKGDQ